MTLCVCTNTLAVFDLVLKSTNIQYFYVYGSVTAVVSVSLSQLNAMCACIGKLLVQTILTYMYTAYTSK